MSINKLKWPLLAGLFFILNCVQVPSVYKVELLNGTHTVGRSEFKIKITDKSTGEGAAGLNVEVTPTMDMITMMHTTPVDSVTDEGNGVYSVIAYYLMNSTGGTWTVNVSVDNEEIGAPIVTVAGDSMVDKAVLMMDMNDLMDATTKRPYVIFPVSCSANGDSTYNVIVFAAVRQTLLSHPALTTNPTITLVDYVSGSWNINTISVWLGTGTGTTTWTSASTELGNGYYQFTNYANACGTTVFTDIAINGTFKFDGSTGATPANRAAADVKSEIVL